VNRIVLRLPADHASAMGHFPGDPIVPGAVLLDEILAIIARAHGARTQGWVVKSVKFLRPVRPGAELEIELAAAPTGDIRFRCWMGASEVVSGLVQV